MIDAVTQANVVWEWSFLSEGDAPRAENARDVDVHVMGPDGRKRMIPAFWAGGKVWTLRFASPTPGEYALETKCSDASDKGLHGRSARLTVTPYRGDNP